MRSTVVAPLLVAVALAVTTLTVLSPPGSDRAGGAAEQADPVPYPVPRKKFVPVRAERPPESTGGRGERVALRQLVIATGQDDFGLATWRSVLDTIGTPYDVLHAGAERLTPERLVRPDGVGRYDAVLLTSNALLRAGPDGTYASGFDAEQWTVLWDYERAYGVRQVSLNAHPGTVPEDLCLRTGTEGAVGDAGIELALPDAGAAVFDHLRPDARIPLVSSYVYRAGLAAGCAAEAVLTAGDAVVGVRSRSPDGRERLALTFSLGPDDVTAALLGPGLVRWATRGVLLGEQRHWFTVDVDDWFNSTARLRADGTLDQFRLSGADAKAASAHQRELRARYPVAGEFTLTLPFNGSRLVTDAPASCAQQTPDTLSSCSRELVREFRWVNHTATHPQMNDTSYDVSRTEISENLAIAAAAGLPVPASVLKTPEYSGLGVYTPDPSSADPPTDFGLTGSNRAMLDAAYDAGVRYVQGNMSFAGHRPSCFNCGVVHPLRSELLVVPDWPTATAFEATAPEEQTALYNQQYGRNGKASDHRDHDLTYEQALDSEAEVAVRHLASGSVYAHTLHQGNLREYAPGRSLGFDWITATVAKYAALHRVPLLSPDWLTLARYVQGRTAHFAELASGRDAVWDRSTGAITYVPGAAGSLFLTGVRQREATEADQAGSDESDSYGADTVARVGLAADAPVVLMASPRP
ncbi:hypothetical protein [Nocardia sp. NRRL S-836]|uniref:Agd3-related carbohydrate-binding protein n=1 Tax=Nocardia sp. NRRL S-836 TaxID=1519492 RepID=UPI0006C3B995|nr:hypothetical protein [Nocardia sp. NRRL S-836]KOV80690.1 hypothetical protein ADL03_31830 [Nocardia sp. NRRL S-836]